jgi:hypothetical protein
MRRIKITGLAIVVMLAMSASAAGTASAAKVLTLIDGETGAPLPAGETIELTGEDNFLIHTSSGSITCKSPYNNAGLELQVLTNSHLTDELLVQRGLKAWAEENCQSELFGNIFIYVDRGSLKLRSTGKATWKEAGLVIGFERNRIECGYSSHSLKGTNNATSSEEPLEVKFSDQKLKLNKGSSKECPKEAELTVSFPSAEFPVEEQI